MTKPTDHLVHRLRTAAQTALRSDPAAPFIAVPDTAQQPSARQDTAERSFPGAEPAVSADDLALLIDRALGRAAEEGRYIP